MKKNSGLPVPNQDKSVSKVSKSTTLIMNRVIEWIGHTKSPYVRVLVLGLLAVIPFFLFQSSLAAGRAFSSNIGQTAQAVEQRCYQYGCKIGEEKYHVSNQVGIHINQLKETAKLEVLRVMDFEYVIEKQENNDYGIDAWLEVPTNGVFTVDMNRAEFLVNELNRELLIRLPSPELTEFAVDHKNAKLIFFKNKGQNESYAQGNDLERAMKKEGYSMGKQECLSNPYYTDSAHNAAVSIVTLLAKQFNPEIPDLKVEVEFME